MSELQCEVCLKPNHLCTCVGAEKKHQKYHSKEAAPLGSKQAPQEDTITEPKGEKNIDVSERQDEELPAPVPEEEAPAPKKGKRKK